MNRFQRQIDLNETLKEQASIKANDEAMLYHWDTSKSMFVSLGPADSSGETVDFIDGGNAFGLN